ncbi:uncharacterized protein BJX67DRAFT_381014 [Aspergillus lucknowensis]|uniref:Uncharacterized protein n=1 Tax=Aspergillus lucknowensis TaxID=176173 RepID=A0ABR4LRZ8_9EURO
MTTATNPSVPHTNNLTSPAPTQLQAQTQAQTAQQPQTQAPHDATHSQAIANHALYPHQISGAGGPAATAPFIRDLSLVAEAAKRAQMAVVTRDLEGVTL